MSNNYIPDGAIGTTIIEKMKDFYNIQETKDLQIFTEETFSFNTSVEIKETKEKNDVLKKDVINSYIDLVNNSDLIKMKDTEGSIMFQHKPLVKIESTVPMGCAYRNNSRVTPIEICVPLIGFSSDEANEILSNNSCTIYGKIYYDTPPYYDYTSKCSMVLLNNKEEEIISSTERIVTFPVFNNDRSRSFNTPSISLKDLSSEEIQDISFCKIILEYIDGKPQHRDYYILKDSVLLSMDKALFIEKEDA